MIIIQIFLYINNHFVQTLAEKQRKNIGKRTPENFSVEMQGGSGFKLLSPNESHIEFNDKIYF